MPIFVYKEPDNYIIMPNSHLRDTTLTLKAKGLLSQLINFPGEWEITITGLAKCNADGVDAIRSAIHELERHGYLTRQQQRKKNGKFAEIVYDVCTNPTAAMPPLKNTPTENSVSENSTEYNNINNKIYNNKIYNNKIYNNLPPHSSSYNRELCGDELEEEEDFITAKVKSQIDYQTLLQNYDEDIVNDIVSVMSDILNFQENKVHLAGMAIPASRVKQAFEQIGYMEIADIITSLIVHHPKVQNMRQYLFSCLYQKATSGRTQTAVDVAASLA